MDPAADRGDIIERDLLVLPPPVEADPPLRLRLLNDVRRGPGFRLASCGRSHFGLSLIVHGAGRLESPAGRIELRAGTLYASLPESWQTVSCDPRRPHRALHLAADGPSAGSLWRDRLGAPGAWQLADSSQIITLFRRMQAEARAAAPYAQEVCSGLLLSLIGLIERARDASPAGARHGEGDSRASFLRCRSRIDSDFVQLRSAQEVAAACGITPGHLCRLFRRHGGTTPYAYLLQRRLEHATELIHGTSLSIAAISEELGFESPYAFSRAFSRIHGHPPSSLRS